MARPGWLSLLTQHGSEPPFMLKFRSSEGFIVGTVALAVFTVCICVSRVGFSCAGDLGKFIEGAD